MASSSAFFCLFILLSFSISTLAHLKSYATSEIESEFKTKGGSHCEYMEVHDPGHSTAALMISCECGSRSTTTLKYSCLYLGNPDVCPQYEENKILFYKEITDVFEKYEPHACLLEEIDASEHTTACRGYPVLMKKRFNDGDDPLQCSGHTEL